MNCQLIASVAETIAVARIAIVTNAILFCITSLYENLLFLSFNKVFCKTIQVWLYRISCFVSVLRRAIFRV
jgi:hypothetical protein